MVIPTSLSLPSPSDLDLRSISVAGSFESHEVIHHFAVFLLPFLPVRSYAPLCHKQPPAARRKSGPSESRRKSSPVSIITLRFAVKAIPDPSVPWHSRVAFCAGPSSCVSIAPSAVYVIPAFQLRGALRQPSPGAGWMRPRTWIARIDEVLHPILPAVRQARYSTAGVFGVFLFSIGNGSIGNGGTLDLIGTYGISGLAAVRVAPTQPG